MKTVIAFRPRSCVTGRNLAKKMSTMPDVFGHVQVVKNTLVIPDTDVYIRWGNSVSFNPNNTLGMNTKTGVNNASNKTKMMSILAQAEGVKTPTFTTTLNGNLDSFKDESGKMFIRGASMSVRYDSTVRSDDLYVMKPIKKKREYRVHVFNGKIIGIYEKVPNEGTDGMIRKAANCKFKKLDPAISTLKKAGQDMAIKAVAALGLLFGGVDVIKDEANNYYINEVNSSPSLNSLNIERWVNVFAEYITSNLPNRGESRNGAQQAQESNELHGVDIPTSISTRPTFTSRNIFSTLR